MWRCPHCGTIFNAPRVCPVCATAAELRSALVEVTAAYVELSLVQDRSAHAHLAQTAGDFCNELTVCCPGLRCDVGGQQCVPL
jgi:hypothetical protein